MAQSGQPAAVTAVSRTPNTTEVVLRSELPASAAEVLAWHERPGALQRLIPPWMPARVLSSQGGIRDGATVTLLVPLGPMSMRWDVEHVHRVEPIGPDRCVLEDRIIFRLPLAPLGPLVAGDFARDRIERMLQWRHALTRADLQRHGAFAKHGAHRIAITGATGFIGDALVPFLKGGGHEVITVGRGTSSDVRWDPSRDAIDAEGLAGVNVVIHLAGAPIAERWTDEHKRELRESRVKGTRLIAESCAAMDPRPDLLICASAIGIYGSRGDEWLDDSSASGDDFLSDIGREWEAAAEPARAAGIRVVHLRTGIVLSPGGGALAKMITPFMLGAGGRLGSGRQWMSWISREDLVGAIHFAMQTPSLHGPVNLTAPEPVTNSTFASTLGRVLHRPSFAAVPAFALKAVFGEMAEATILASQRVRPAKLTAAGFQFLHPTLSSALRFELGLL